MLLFCTLLFLCFVRSSSSETLSTTVRYYPKAKNSDGSMDVVVHMKVGSRDCGPGLWQCFSGDCGNETSSVSRIIYGDKDEYCQVEQINTLRVPTNAPFEIRTNLGEDGGQDISGDRSKWRNLTLVDLRIRSDTGKPNSSPQTSALPNIRAPVNCQRTYQLLRFDPDGDDVQCRFMTIVQLECEDCVPGAVRPVFFKQCAVLYTPNVIRPGNTLKVDYLMEDFPKADVNLTYTNGTREARNRRDGIGKVPVQFIFTVAPAVPDCEEGLYLPKLLPPTPENEAQVYTAVQQPIAIFIRFTANFSSSSELLHNGPFGMMMVRTGLTEYALLWTPTEEDVNHHPLCYVVQVSTLVGTHQSELRCLVVTVVNVPQFLPMTPANGTSLSATVNQPIVVFIHVETPSNVSELLVLGPDKMTNSSLGNGLFLLRWTPSDEDAGKNFTVVFFVVFSNFIFSPNPLYNYYQSEFRTITLKVKNGTVSDVPIGSVFLRTKIISATPLSDDFIQSAVLKQLKEELVTHGLAPQITLRLISHRKKEETPPK